MDHYWCQGFSEPGAGSDLSALRCAAMRDGDDYLVNGSKIWTTHALAANWIFLLVRTASEGAPQAGITFLLSPMDAPGITVRPIRSMSGEHEVNEVFFDNVRIPASLRVGEEHRGWDVAKFLLMHERGSTSAAAALKNALRRTRLVAAGEHDEQGRSITDNPGFRSRLAALKIEIAAIEAAELHDLKKGRPMGAAGMASASVQRLKVSSMLQRLAEMAVEALGVSVMRDYWSELYGAHSNGLVKLRETAVARHLNIRAATIFGGATEIQKGIVARSGLGI
jgi:alkylation response protein AidB-like acyl-CoA dehydrogenase